MTVTRELAATDAQTGAAISPTRLPATSAATSTATSAGLPVRPTGVAVLLRGASMRALEAALAAGAIATALLLGVGR